MDPVFLVYMVKPADDPNTMIAIPSCKAVGPSVGDATGCCADESSGMLKIFVLEVGWELSKRQTCTRVPSISRDNQ